MICGKFMENLEEKTKKKSKMGVHDLSRTHYSWLYNLQEKFYVGFKKGNGKFIHFDGNPPRPFDSFEEALKLAEGYNNDNTGMMVGQEEPWKVYGIKIKEVIKK
jgi:hypothetical protein